MNGEEETLFRSQDMSLVQLYIPSELAYSAVSELGELGLVQFRDLNGDSSSFQRTFVNEIRRLDDMERKIRFLAAQIEKAEISMNLVDPQGNYGRSRTVKEMDELEGTLTDIEARILQMNGSFQTLNKRFLELTELRYVLRETAVFFEQAKSKNDTIGAGKEELDSPLLGRSLDVESAEMNRSSGLSFVAGIIPRNRMATFERVLWRVLRGNLYLNYSEIEEPIHEPVTDDNVSKNVFVVFVAGQELKAKIKKISESLGATIYPVDPNPGKRSEDALEVSARIEDLNNVLYNTSATRRAELMKVAEVIDQWTVFVKKAKGTYHTMNLFNYDSTRKCLIAEGWCPSSAINSIQYSLHSVGERSGSMVPPVLNRLRTVLEPPTCHKTNKFTEAFQSIVDAYGHAKYKEVNPGLFTIITFPFLFAVMFGDFGHGIFLTLIAVYLILNEKKFTGPGQGEMVRMVFGGRFIMLLMGLFSIYVGLIYNDIFSLPVSMFPSMWYVNEEQSKTFYLRDTSVAIYPFGVDHNWHLSGNALLFLNSYKMKMSIILGVAQMTFGIVLTVFNSKYFKKPLNIYCEFIPQIIFMMSIFGYLCFLIIFKWFQNYAESGKEAPGLLNTLIFMFLQLGVVKPKDQLFEGQQIVQQILLFLSVICVPWMLVIKPWYLYREHKAKLEAGYAIVENGSPDTSSTGGSPNHGHGSDSVELHHGEKFDFGEIIVHQVIHTIEFCLGCISNTASYLRLWALSLAHAQLSEVLWDMTIRSNLNSNMIIVGYALWFTLTFGILIGMEGLSAFLHALRLHWVEFNNKFYEASGAPFVPFSFVSILSDGED